MWIVSTVVEGENDDLIVNCSVLLSVKGKMMIENCSVCVGILYSCTCDTVITGVHTIQPTRYTSPVCFSTFLASL